MKDNIATRIWSLVYPLGMYYVTVCVALYVAQLFFGSGAKTYMTCQILSSLVALPVIYQFYRQDRVLEGTWGQKVKIGKKHVLSVIYAVAVAALIGFALNNIICMTPLVEMSEGYQDASQNFYGSTLYLELLGSAIITPLLEELLYRGIIYKRMEKMTGFLPALFTSSFIFAFMHFNLVQFIYAFLLGLVLACMMHEKGHMYVAVAGHMGANALAVIRTELGMFEKFADGSLVAWIVSVGCLLLGILILFLGRTKSGKGSKS